MRNRNHREDIGKQIPDIECIVYIRNFSAKTAKAVKQDFRFIMSDVSVYTQDLIPCHVLDSIWHNIESLSCPFKISLKVFFVFVFFLNL